MFLCAARWALTDVGQPAVPRGAGAPRAVVLDQQERREVRGRAGEVVLPLLGGGRAPEVAARGRTGSQRTTSSRPSRISRRHSTSADCVSRPRSSGVNTSRVRARSTASVIRAGTRQPPVAEEEVQPVAVGPQHARLARTAAQRRCRRRRRRGASGRPSSPAGWAPRFSRNERVWSSATCVDVGGGQRLAERAQPLGQPVGEQVGVVEVAGGQVGVGLDAGPWPGARPGRAGCAR